MNDSGASERRSEPNISNKHRSGNASVKITEDKTSSVVCNVTKYQKYETLD